MTKTDKKCFNLEDFKKRYSEIQKKYSLPKFKEMNEDFQIEKISEVETEYLIREVRKFIADKFGNYLRFIETILNPTNAGMFVFSFVKSLSVEDKKVFSEAYKSLQKMK